MINITNWTRSQLALIEPPYNKRAFAFGPAGSGKTSAACKRLIQMIASGVPSESILILVPQRTLAVPYQDTMASSFWRENAALKGMIPIQTVTLGGLARRMVELFWPLISDQASFSAPQKPPVFLTLETAQFFMARIARPFLEQGAFSSIHLERNRLYSQIIDNLNKASIVGFDHTEIAQRLKSAWSGEPSYLRVFDDVQGCANEFRKYCLDNNLLDFSLQIEIFARHLWNLPECHTYLTQTYRHLIVDNIEEDTPVCHSILMNWLASADSAAILYDTNAGYRRFLGADPNFAMEIQSICDESIDMGKNFVMDESIAQIEERFCHVNAGGNDPATQPIQSDVRERIALKTARFYPEMLDQIAAQIAELVSQGVAASEIAVLSPYLSDSLRYSLAQRLDRYGIMARSHRPSRAVRDEPITNCLLTLAMLAHREWTLSIPELVASPSNVAYALMQAIEGLDLIRAQLLVEFAYKDGDLLSFAQVPAPVQERITYVLGDYYENLRNWLSEHQLDIKTNPLELDHFLSKLFGEVLSQPGYGFHKESSVLWSDTLPFSSSAGEITANLIESIQKFRRVVNATAAIGDNQRPVGLEYFLTVQEGLLASQYIRSWVAIPDNVIMLAPAYTFLLENRPVGYQFWVDVGSRSWGERLYQPLTHPFVLSQSWPLNKKWTDIDEVRINQQILQDLVIGLLRRCRKQIFLGFCNYSEQGFEQRGPLVQLFQQLLFTEMPR